VDFSDWENSESYRAHIEVLLRELGKRFDGVSSTPPDAETRYLNSLLADLERIRGVLQYVPLDTIARGPDQIVDREDEWAFDVLVDVRAGQHQPAETHLYGIDALLREHRMLALLGDGGAGKSTTLRWLARRAGLARRQNPRTHALPVLIPMGQWQAGQSVDELIVAACPMLRDTDLSLAAGDLLLLFDGLNEMGAQGREKAAELRRWLSALPSPPQVVFTCRPTEYAGFNLGDLPTAVLRDLDDEQMRLFASRYLASRAEAFLDQVLPKNEVAEHAQRAIVSLARNPYMLSAFIYLYENSPEERLPSNTGVLFSKLSTALWTREARRKRRASQLSATDWTVAKASLAIFARTGLESTEGDDTPLMRARELIGDDGTLPAALEAGLLIQSGEFVRFSHDLLRAYFVAESLCQVDPDTLDGWCREHIDHWQTVSVAWSGISPSADRYFARLSFRDAALLLSRGYFATEDAILPAFGDAMGELAVDHWRSFQPAMDALTEMGSAIVPLLIKELSSESSDLRSKVAFVLGRIRDGRAVDALIPMLDDPSPEVVSRTGSALVSIGGDPVWEALESKFHHQSASLRVGAAKAIARRRPPGGFDVLIELVTDPEDSVRTAATEALGSYGDQRAVGPIAKLASAEQTELRTAAIAALAQLGGDEARASVLAALRDDRESVRVSAALGMKRFAGTTFFPELANALQDTSALVRIRAAEALSVSDNVASTSALQRVLDDPAPEVRRAALHALATRPESQMMLLERLRSPDSELWAACAEELDRLGWSPLDAADSVRWYAATGRLSRSFELGDQAITGLRSVLEVGTESHRHHAADVLHKLAWRPHAVGRELLDYYAARVDWDAHDRLHPIEILNLRGWLGASKLDSPIRRVAAEIVVRPKDPTEEAFLADVMKRQVPHGWHWRTQCIATATAGLAR
jgi:HEAT repeat protein